MDAIQKFCSDVEKIKKSVRSQNPVYDLDKACQQIKNLFVRNNRGMESLAQSFADYWENTYIKAASNSDGQPDKENLDRLVAMLSLMSGSTEFTDILSDDDWKELCSLTNMEAEDLPLDTLNDMMSIFVDKKAL